MSQQKLNIRIESPRVENSIDLPIGTSIKIGKVQYHVARPNRQIYSNGCEGCMMSTELCPFFRCTSMGRHDHKEVIFIITNLEDQL